MSNGTIEFEHAIGFNTIIDGLKVHRNGQNYIYSTGGNLIIGDLTDPHSQSFLRRHDDQITCLSISPGGRFVASGQRGMNSDVHVWDYDSKQLLYTFEEHDTQVTAIAFSDDEKIIATLGADSRLILWDMSNGLVIAIKNKITAGTSSVCFGGFVKDVKRRNTDQYLLATCGPDGITIHALDPYSGDMESINLQTANAPRRHVTHINFSSDGDNVYGATTSGDMVVGNVRGKRMSHCIPACKKGLNCLVTTSTGVYAGGGDHTIKFLAPSSQSAEYEVLKSCELDSPVVALSLSYDNNEAIAATSGGSVYRINTATMKYITISESHTDSVVGVAFSPGNSEKMATASLDGTLKVWDLAEYVVIATGYPLRSQERGVVPLCIDMSDMILSGWNDGHVLAHDINTGEHLWVLDKVHGDGVTSLTISHNNRFFLTGGNSGDVRLWELRSRDLISHLKEHTSKINTLALYNDDAIALSGSRDRCILRWDLRKERRVYCNMQRMGGINDMLISKDENYIVSVGQDRTLTYWVSNQEDCTHKIELNGDNDEGRAITLTNDGRFLCTGGTEGVVRLWSYEAGSQLANCIGHSGIINSIKFSGDDRQVVSVGDDGCIFIYNLFTG